MREQASVSFTIKMCSFSRVKVKITVVEGLMQFTGSNRYSRVRARNATSGGGGGRCSGAAGKSSPNRRTCCRPSSTCTACTTVPGAPFRRPSCTSSSLPAPSSWAIRASFRRLSYLVRTSTARSAATAFRRSRRKMSCSRRTSRNRLRDSSRNLRSLISFVSGNGTESRERARGVGEGRGRRNRANTHGERAPRSIGSRGIARGTDYRESSRLLVVRVLVRWPAHVFVRVHRRSGATHDVRPVHFHFGVIEFLFVIAEVAVHFRLLLRPGKSQPVQLRLPPGSPSTSPLTPSEPVGRGFLLSTLRTLGSSIPAKCTDIQFVADAARTRNAIGKKFFPCNAALRAALALTQTRISSGSGTAYAFSFTHKIIIIVLACIYFAAFCMIDVRNCFVLIALAGPS